MGHYSMMVGIVVSQRTGCHYSGYGGIDRHGRADRVMEMVHTMDVRIGRGGGDSGHQLLKTKGRIGQLLNPVHELVGAKVFQEGRRGDGF